MCNCVEHDCDLTGDATRSVYFSQLRLYDLKLFYKMVDGFEIITIEKKITHTAGTKSDACIWKCSKS